MKDNFVFEPYGFIYIITNKLNGMRYIGQKKFDNASRWKSYMGGGNHLLRAIRKYGKDNFYRDIVAIAYSEEELNDLEKIWISNYNAVNDLNYYNKIDGGDVLSSLNRINSFPVICIDNGKIFLSLSDASIWSGYTVKKIKKTFRKSHNPKKFGKDNYVFRPYIKLEKGKGYCQICGEIFVKSSNRQKRCEYHMYKNKK